MRSARGDAGVPDQKTARRVRLLPSKILKFIPVRIPALPSLGHHGG